MPVPAKEKTTKKKRETNVCAKCGAQVKIGDWPWCPHSKLPPSRRLWNWVK